MLHCLLMNQSENSFLQATVEKLGPLPDILADIARDTTHSLPIQQQLRHYPDHNSSPNVSLSSGLQKIFEDPSDRYALSGYCSHYVEERDMHNFVQLNRKNKK